MIYKVVRDIDGVAMYRFFDKEDAVLFMEMERERALEDIQYEKEKLERTEKCLEAMKKGKAYFHYIGHSGEDTIGYCPKSIESVLDDKLLSETRIISAKKNIRFHLVEER